MKKFVIDNAKTSALILCGAIVSVLLSSCSSLGMGSSGAKTEATGSAGGSTASGANKKLERCNKSLGTVSVEEDNSADWNRNLRDANLGPTSPVIRLIIQQSNCFVIVERGKSMNSMMRERQLEDSGEIRKGSKFQKGQMVAADYTVSPSVLFNEQTGGAASNFLSTLGGNASKLLGLAGNAKASEANTVLTLIDNRSGVQIAAAEGSAKNWDFGGMVSGVGSILGNAASGSLGAYGKTPQGKVIVAAFMDSYNQMVRSLRDYKAQTVEGGLGKGGNLKVGD